MTTHNFRNKIYYLSFILSVMIVYRHSVAIEIYSEMPSWLRGVELYISHITDLIVPTFFVLSGYLFFQNLSNHNILAKLKSRFSTIVIPFFIWSLIGYLYLLLISQIVGTKLNLNIPEFEPISWFVDVFIFTKYNATWFLLNLICYIYLSPIILILIKNKMVGISCILVLIFSGIYFNNSLLAYAAPYALGGFFGIHAKSLVTRSYSRVSIIISAVFLVSTTLIEAILNMPQGISLIPLRLVQSVAIWIIADYLAIDSTPKWWMTISFFIYCSHSIILESLEKVILISFKDTATGAIIDIIFAPILTICTIYLIASICRKAPFVWKLLTGNRGISDSSAK